MCTSTTQKGCGIYLTVAPVVNETDTLISKAVRYHLLVNPTGQNGKFRSVDWCVELNNLFTKV